MPKVSVIVPIYNVENYLRECLESIVNQTLEDIEIICVNDGSTDSSLSIIEEYASKDRRIKVINKTNSGYGHSMNMGLSHSIGDYIGIVESDDFAAPEMFQKLYDAAQKNDAEVVKSNFFEYRSEPIGKKLYENLVGCPYYSVFSPTDEQTIFFALPSIWSGLYKRSFLVENRIQFLETSGASYQDTSFAFKVWASAKRVFLLRDALLFYRKDNMDSSVNSAAKVFCICDEYEEIEKFMDSHPSKKEKLTSLAFAMKFRAYKWNYNRLASVFQYAFLLKMNEQFNKTKKEEMIHTNYLSELENKEVLDIIYNPDQYFKETAKGYLDDRLFINSTLNQQIYKKVFLETIGKYQKIIVFGAGAIGKKVTAKIMEENIGNFYCFAVSNKAVNPETIFGYPVHSINNLGEHINDSIVIIAVKERDQYEIIRTLKSLQFKNIVSIDSKLLNTLTN
jgi:glycosyltransferase involved in cell wall biosynthesis